METLTECASALSRWVYTIMSVQIPFLNVSLWLLAISLFAFRMLLKVTDVVTHRNTSGGGMESNNNHIYGPYGRIK